VSEYDALIGAAKSRGRTPTQRTPIFGGSGSARDFRKNFRRLQRGECTYGLTVCAERVAIFRRSAKANADSTPSRVVADTDSLTAPCGACRQLIWDLRRRSGVLANLKGKVEVIRNELPFPSV